MKYHIQQKLFAVACALLGIGQLWAGDFEYNGLKYTTLTDSTCEVKQGVYNEEANEWTCGNDVSGDIVIPEVVYDGEKAYTVTEIGQFTFIYREGIKSIVIPNTITTIGRSAFAYTGISTFDIPKSVTTMVRSVFFGCSALESIVIPESITEIGDVMFWACTKLASVSLPNSIKRIGENAFGTCESLTSFVLPESVDSLGLSVFYGCYGLTNVDLGNSIKDLGEYTFYECTNLETIVIPRSVTHLDEALFSHCTGLKSVSIPNTVTVIGPGVFCRCKSLTSVDIPNSVTELGDGAFVYSGIETISIPGSVTFMDDGALQECDSLKVVRFEDSDVAVEFGPSPLLGSTPEEFYFGRQVDCSTIDFSKTKIVAFGEKITSIADSAFVSGTAIRTVKSSNPVPPETNDTFSSETYTDGTLYVPETSIDAYATAPGWKEFKNIKALDTTTSASVINRQDTTFSVSNGTLHISGDAAVRVMAMNGAVVYSGNGTRDINLNKGLYIVTINNIASKVIIR